MAPHHLALFSLRPYGDNERAKRSIAHPNNSHIVSTLSDGTPALGVGFHLRGQSSQTPATLRRGLDTVIYVEGSDISRVQFSFEIDSDTGVVMRYDRSFAKSTQVFGPNAKPFERERDQRKVLVQWGLNTCLGMGGERGDLVQFLLDWHQDPLQTAELIREYDALSCGRVEKPRLARTVHEAPIDLLSRRETRIHTPGQRQSKMRYMRGEKLGSGQFGTAHKAINVDSGKLMAVKILKPR